MKLKLDRRFTNQVKGTFEKYSFEVGVLNDSPHKLPLTGEQKVYAGGPARKLSRRDSGLSISEVSKKLRENTGVNIYKKPFSIKTNKEIRGFSNEFFKVCTGRSQPKRLTNLLQAIVRNPILRGDYGRNSKVTEKIKGFNRYMIDTGQLFRAIIAKVKIKNV